MNCEVCAKHPIIGDVYRLQAGLCFRCGHLFSGSDFGNYRGMDGGKHIFRLHPSKVCPVCGIKLRFAKYNCEDETPLDVTEEYRQLEYQKNPGSAWNSY